MNAVIRQEVGHVVMAMQNNEKWVCRCFPSRLIDVGLYDSVKFS